MNLDAMMPDEVLATQTRRLRRYARKKYRAMLTRLSGNIAKAQRMEAECDAIYAKFPKELRW